MRKETRKEFVVGKDYSDEFVELHKGDIIQILPIEFFDETDFLIPKKTAKKDKHIVKKDKKYFILFLLPF